MVVQRSNFKHCRLKWCCHTGEADLWLAFPSSEPFSVIVLLTPYGTWVEQQQSRQSRSDFSTSLVSIVFSSRRWETWRVIWNVNKTLVNCFSVLNVQLHGKASVLQGKNKFIIPWSTSAESHCPLSSFRSKLKSKQEVDLWLWREVGGVWLWKWVTGAVVIGTLIPISVPGWCTSSLRKSPVLQLA